MPLSKYPHRLSAACAMLAFCASLTLPAGAQTQHARADAAAQTGSWAARKAVPASACQPAWPEDAPQNLDGRVTRLMLQVDAKGAVKRSKLVQSSSSTALDKAVIDAANHCTFIPALKRGKPVAATVTLEHDWSKSVPVHVQQAMPVTEAVTVPAKLDFTSCAKPQWPKMSLRNEETGTVTMALLIDTDGTVKETQLKRSSGFPDLDNAALDALARCKFEPGTRSGQPYASWATLQYVWTLE